VISALLVLLYAFRLSGLLLVVLSATTLLIVYLLFHPRNQWLVANRSRVDGEGCVALTFDDGPDPVDTPTGCPFQPRPCHWRCSRGS
jgi:hypothetical protein